MKNKPHVAILVGPFVDDRHGRIAAGETDGKTYKVRAPAQKLAFLLDLHEYARAQVN